MERPIKELFKYQLLSTENISIRGKLSTGSFTFTKNISEEMQYHVKAKKSPIGSLLSRSELPFCHRIAGYFQRLKTLFLQNLITAAFAVLLLFATDTQKLSLS